MKSWFITGVSRGFGEALAQAALARGDRVIGTVRDPEAVSVLRDRLQLVPLELADPASIDAAVATAFQDLHTVDVIVNNAGYGLFGSLEETTEDQLSSLFDVDVFGPMRVLRAALPRLRAQGSGHVVNIASVAGINPLPGYGAYSAAKAAILALSQVLAQEVDPLGIKVTAVTPGSFRTDFLSAHSMHKTADNPAYAATAGTNVARFEKGAGKQPGDPSRAAQAILQLVDMADPPRQLLLGTDALERASASLTDLLGSVGAHRALSQSTDYPHAGE